MDLLIVLAMGIVYGRNWSTINQRAYQDACKIATALMHTQMGITTIYVLEAIVRACEKNDTSCMHSIMCQCNRRRCPGRTVSIDYYARQLKAAK